MTAELRHSSLLRSAGVVGACTMLSRVFGLLRDVLMASFFGTSLVQSAFVIAFRIPNLFRRLFGEGALSAAFIPVFSESIEKQGRESAWRLATAMMTLLGTVLAAVVVAVILVTSASMGLLALGEKAAMVLSLLRIMFPYMFFICMVALCMAILNSFHHFLVPAITPVLLNLVWIATLFLICPLFGDRPEERIYGVAWGVFAAGAVQLAAQFPVLMRYGYRFRLSFNWRDPRIGRVLLLMGPAAVGMGVIQINALIDNLLAMLVAGWAPAALYFAEMVVHLPLGIFATALGTVLLPTFSRQAARAEPDAIKTTLNQSMRMLLFIMLPASVGLAVLAGPVIELLFEWPGREFDAVSTTQTARALVFYAPGLVAFGLYKVLVPAFYAMKDTLRPVRVAVWVVCLNFALNLLFIFTWPEGYKHAGLAFATVLSSTVNVVVLGIMLHKRIGSPGWLQIAGRGLRMLVAAVVMGAAAFASHALLSRWLASAGLPPKIAQTANVAGSIAAGVGAYVGLALAFCREETADLMKAAPNKKPITNGR